MLSEEQLQALEKKALAAKVGNWVVYGDSNLKGWEIEIEGSMEKIVRDDKGVIDRADADYMVAVQPWVILSLIADYRLIRDELSDIRECEAFEDEYRDAPKDYFKQAYLWR